MKNIIISHPWLLLIKWPQIVLFVFILLSSHWLIFRIIITTICCLFFLPLMTIFVSSSTFFFKVYTLFSPKNIVLKYLSSTPHSPFMCEPSSATPHLLLSLATPHPLRAAQDIIWKFISSSASFSRLHGNFGTESLENLWKYIGNTRFLHLINTMRFHFKKLWFCFGNTKEGLFVI